MLAGKFACHVDGGSNVNPEALFLCKILTLTYKSLGDDTIVALKNCATKMAENQPMEQKQQQQAQKNVENKNKEVSVDKYVEFENNNNFGVLHGDIIDHFSTFLSDAKRKY